MEIENPDLFDDEATDDDDSSSSLNQSAEVYVVEKILRRRYNATEKIFEYELKWKNYPDSENTWEPESSLKCDFLLKQFNEKLQRKKEEKTCCLNRRSQEDKKFIAKDNESLSQSSWTADSGDEQKKEKLNKNKSISSSSSKFKRFSNRVKNSQKSLNNVKKKELPVPETSRTKSRPQSRKKKLGEILSYDDIPIPSKSEEDISMNSGPSSSISPASKKIKKEAMHETRIPKKKSKLVGKQVKKEEDISSTPQKLSAKQSTEDVSEDITNRKSRSRTKSASREAECSITKSVILPEQALMSLEEEEESDINFQLDMNNIPYKIIEEGEENGFDRGWEVERILILIRDDIPEATDLKSQKYAIVKFKGFKYSQKILLSEVNARAPQQLLKFLKEEMSLQLQSRCLKGRNRHKNK